MNKKIFEEYSIPKAIFSLAFPTIVGMLINVIYNMADVFFVGQTNDASQVAAVTLIMPIFLLLMSFGNIFGIGGGAYISRLLGKKETDKIKNTSSFCFYSCILIGIISCFVINIFMDTILKMLGANDLTHEFSREYLKIISFGAPLICVQMAFTAIVRAEGAAKQSMIGMMIGTILNIILDPVMILGMNLGVKGAAIATVIGNFASCAYFVFYCLRKNTYISLSIKNFNVTPEILKNIFFIGIPVSLNTILISISTMVLNNYAAFYSENVVAAFGIANRISMIVVMLLLGLSQGSQPFIAYNYAAKNFDRMIKAIKFSSIVSILIGTVLFALICIFQNPFVAIFIDNPEVIGYAKRFVVLIMASSPVLGLLFMSMSTFQAMGKGLPSLIVAVLRQGVLFIPAILIGNKLFGLNGLAWAQPFSDFTSIIIACLIFTYFYKKMIKH